MDTKKDEKCNRFDKQIITSQKELDNQKRSQEELLASVRITGTPDGRSQVYINDRLVPGVRGYKIEHNSSDKRVPHLILEIQCDLNMDSGAIPILPEPWSWFYEPKYPNFVDERDIN